MHVAELAVIRLRCQNKGGGGGLKLYCHFAYMLN